MLIVGLSVAAVSIGFHYRTSMLIEQQKILEVIEGQARLIAAVSRFDEKFSNTDHPLGAKGATLSQLIDTLSHHLDTFYSDKAFLAHRDKHNNLVLDYAPPGSATSPLSGVSEQAFNLALEGGSGSLFGIDNKGQQVLIAYTYLPDLARGLVAKVEMRELRAPFIHASLLATLVSVLFIIFGTMLFKQIQQLKILPHKQGVILGGSSGIKEYERFFYLVIVMTVMCIAVNLSSAIVLYSSSYQRSQEHLLHLVSSQASAIESIARFDAKYSQDDHPQGAEGATLSQVIDAYNHSLGFGETGEYVIGHRVVNNVEIIFHQRHNNLQHSRLIYSSVGTEPMHLALNGLKGVMMGPDHQGNEVLAAHSPLTPLSYGLVAKIDLTEVRAPFIRGMVFTSSVALCIIILASVLLARMTRPFQEQKVNPFETPQWIAPPIPLSLLVFTIGLTGGIFLLDLITPLGIAGGVPYAAVIAIGWWFPQRQHILLLATLVSILTLLIFYANADTQEWKSLINRCYSLFSIWVIALILNLAKASDIARKEQANTLKKLSLAVECSPTGVMITAPNGTIEYVNPHFLDNTEYSAVDLLGQDPKILNSGETPSTVFDEMWSTINSGREWRGEIINRKKNGELYWEDTAIFPILSERGEIQNFVCLKENITQRKQAENALQFKATHDSLTGLPTVHLGKECLTNAIARAKREQDKAALLFIDLDGFKAVNDSFGHDTGDLILQAVAARLKSSIREVDAAARIGGDEFIIILGGIKQQSDVESVAKKVVHAISQPYNDIEMNITLGCSIGIALYPDHGDEAEILIKHADVAMYAVKHSGKNNYRIYREN